MKYEPGWNGGTWFSKGESIKTLNSKNKEYFVKIKNEFIPIKETISYGTDNDHGTVSNWEIMDFNMQLETVIGVIDKKLLDYTKKSKKFEIDIM